MVRPLTALLTALALLVPAGAPAAADEPPLLNWGALVPGLALGHDPSSSNTCTAGHARCVESVLRTMARDFQRLARTCDHDAVFQLGYLRTTEAYYESSQIPGFYDDVAWMHHYDAVFAEFYLSPQRAWQRGRVDDVPPAWRTAFGAAAARELSTTGSFLLGMNAHINRDLPFVLDAIGLTDAEGRSRKPDHERVNAFLNVVPPRLIPEMAARFDPSWADPARDNVVAGLTTQQAIQAWREAAWTNAWLLTYAPAPVAALVAEGIEAGSAQLGEVLRAATTVDAAGRAARDAHCAAHWDDWAPGPGGFFDGQEEPPYDWPSVDLPNPTTTLDALMALGVRVDVDPASGVVVRVDPVLLGDLAALPTDLLGGAELPVVPGLLEEVGGVLDPVVGGLLDPVTGGLPRLPLPGLRR